MIGLALWVTFLGLVEMLCLPIVGFLAEFRGRVVGLRDEATRM